MPKLSSYASNGTLDYTETVPIIQSGANKVMALSALTGRLFAKSAGLWYPLAASAVGASCPADTTEDTLATVTIPAGAMGANGQLRIMSLWSFTNSGNNKTLRIRFGGASGTAYLSSINTTSATYNIMTRIANANSASSQKGPPSTGAWNNSSGAVVTSAIDTSASADLVFTGQKASSGETLTLEAYSVDILYAA